MIALGIRRIKPEHRAELQAWLLRVNTELRDEAIATLVAEGVTHEKAVIVDTSDGPLLVYAMETNDPQRAEEVSSASESWLDAEHRRVMHLSDGGAPSRRKVLDVSAPIDLSR
ncbi:MULTISPECIES: DUF6176 family protein [unclassified Microbacterium]|uniref:DUF6176 family protein n=1 Tax=unclassified Microbacterium TaxID=2609290 RepID=UPI00214CB1CE|nr:MULTISPECIES: DUF6176 family protein [unclassified Microbacterium]MCR2783909.1 DUF6176 family protein [Microbacterium sp. zg.B96]MDL5351299.1 DUF6176 family protein [Microbacterium sp. zg-YB36]WIM15246.1 DUF6176 family protein [Microbacterium sp. zg-B96]